MVKALVVMVIASAVAIMAMAVIFQSMMDHGEELNLQQDILATKAAEAREYPGSNSRVDQNGGYVPIFEEYSGTSGSQFPQEHRSSPFSDSRPTP